MAVEGEFAHPFCINPSCNRRLPLKRSGKAFKRYGLDMVCDRCWKALDYRTTGPFIQCLRHERWYRKHEEQTPENSWLWLGREMAASWARVRLAVSADPFPAGLSIFLIEIHNVR